MKIRTVSRERRKPQRGSAALEAALVILPTMAMCFALIDFPMMLFVQETLEDAVRVGVRYAITQQSNGSSQDASIKSVIQNNSLGYLSDSNVNGGNATINIQYYDINLNPVSGTGSNAQGNIIVITATVKRFWIVPIYVDKNLDTYSASSSDVMEAPPGGTPPVR